MLLIMVCILGVFGCVLLYCGLAASKNAEAQWKELERKVYEKKEKRRTIVLEQTDGSHPDSGGTCWECWGVLEG